MRYITVIVVICLSITLSNQVRNLIQKDPPQPVGCTNKYQPDDCCDESKNPDRPNLCYKNNECAYGRYCNMGQNLCAGTAKPCVPACEGRKDQNAKCNEETNQSGYVKCKTDKDCQLGRKCQNKTKKCSS